MVHQVDAKDAVNGNTVKPTKILTSGVLKRNFPLTAHALWFAAKPD